MYFACRRLFILETVDNSACTTPNTEYQLSSLIHDSIIVHSEIAWNIKNKLILVNMLVTGKARKGDFSDLFPIFILFS